MRSVAESLNVPAPPSMSLLLLQEELVANLHMPSDKLDAWRSALDVSHPTCQVCGDIMTLSVPAPPSMSLALNFSEGMCMPSDMPSDKLSAWRSALDVSHPTCQTCADIMTLNSEEMRAAFEKAELTNSEVATVRLCLGTAADPFHWCATTVTEDELDVKPKKATKKGGPKSEKAEVLVIRRPDMGDGQYFPHPV